MTLSTHSLPKWNRRQVGSIYVLELLLKHYFRLYTRRTQSQAKRRPLQSFAERSHIGKISRRIGKNISFVLSKKDARYHRGWTSWFQKDYRCDLASISYRTHLRLTVQLILSGVKQLFLLYPHSLQIKHFAEMLSDLHLPQSP
jgi:hypothetical protein